MKLFIEKHAEIHHDSGMNAVVVKWKDFASPEDYQKTIETAYEIALEKNCPHWVSDMTSGKAVSISSVNWLRNIWIPTMAKEGIIRKIAVLIDYNPERENFADILKEIVLLNGISFKSFRIKSELEKWIKGQNSDLQNDDQEKASYSQYF